MGNRLRLTLSYAAFVLLTGALLLATVWLFLLRYVPERIILPGRPPLRVPNRSDLLAAFVPRAAVVMLVLLLLGLLVGWIVAGRMLAPLNRVARLEAYAAEQQRFAAKASHELRTPLAITRALLEVARKDPAHDELLDRLHAVNERAIDLIEALLLLGRGELARTAVDLSLLVEEAAETLLFEVEARQITLTVTGETARVDGSPELLSRLVLNLVQNAVRHNLPTGGTVTVHTAGTTLRVENTGSPAARAQDGPGLGLSIVRSIVAAHHGTLALAPRPGGGLHATVTFPS
jgi:two-component system, OmpR family, sensor histidine kinase VanS